MAVLREPEAVPTPSSEQAPGFTDAMNLWRGYEPWPGPLKAALGPVPDACPATPEAGRR